jgi:hypothetical protein
VDDELFKKCVQYVHGEVRKQPAPAATGDLRRFQGIPQRASSPRLCGTGKFIAVRARSGGGTLATAW